MPSPSSATRAEVEEYSDDVLRNKIRCELPDCAACGTSPDLFRRHQARPRRFYILCETMVQTILCLVIRWRCPGCRKTFTQQPPFAFPRKRYTRETILDLSAHYVEDQAATYRSTVLGDEGMEIFHASRSKQEPICNKSLSHSTPYRWITCLGVLRQILRSAQDMILQKNPASTVCRDLAALEICARKVVKAGRESVLKHCRQILHLEVRFRAAFHTSIFPLFATRCGWG